MSKYIKSLKALTRTSFKRVVFFSILGVMLFSAVSPAFATPMLSSPANGATVTNNYPASPGSPVSWIPYLSWNDDRLTVINNNYIEIATNSTINPNYGTFLPNYLVASIFKTTTFWDVANSTWPDNAFYLAPGTYYWHVRGRYGYSFDYDFQWSSIYSFTVPTPPPPPAPVPPIIGFTPGNFYFVMTQGGAIPPSQMLTLINLGTLPVTYHLNWPGGSLVTLAVPDPLKPAEISVIPWSGVNTLTPGIYNTVLTITAEDSLAQPASNSPQYVNVVFDIKGPSEALYPTPTPLISTSLSASAKPKTIKLGKSSLIKGRLVYGSGTPVAGKKIKIKAGKKLIKQVTTSAAGYYSYKVKPKKTTAYKAYFAGSLSYKAASSKSIKVVVK